MQNAVLCRAVFLQMINLSVLQLSPRDLLQLDPNKDFITKVSSFK